jgi:hypothetical protein
MILVAMDFGSGLQALPGFIAFRHLIRNNLGIFPDITFDRTGLSGHRVRFYQDPPAVELRYSERALARSIELADLVVQAKQKNSAAILAAGLFAMRGAEFLKKNRFAGLAFVVRAFRDIRFEAFPHSVVVAKAIESGGKPGATVSLINLLLPLAHEIGHLPEAQRFCPRDILGDKILETYRINYRQVAQFTGTFDYEAALDDPNSPLNLKIVREEVASDFFAALALSNLIAQSFKKAGNEFPLDVLGQGLLLFPLVMALDALCFKDVAPKRFLQEITLAMHCRYSVMIDSLRGCSKAIFQSQSNFKDVAAVIDEAVDRYVEDFDALYRLTWDAFLIVMKDSGALVEQSNERYRRISRNDLSGHGRLPDFGRERDRVAWLCRATTLLWQHYGRRQKRPPCTLTPRLSDIPAIEVALESAPRSTDENSKNTIYRIIHAAAPGISRGAGFSRKTDSADRAVPGRRAQRHHRARGRPAHVGTDQTAGGDRQSRRTGWGAGHRRCGKSRTRRLHHRHHEREFAGHQPLDGKSPLQCK